MADPATRLADARGVATLADRPTWLHGLDARAKLAATLVFLGTMLSFGKYAVLPLIPYCSYPLALCAAGGIPLSHVARRVLLASPFAVLLGLFNPLLDRQVLVQLGPLALTGGWVSFASIVLRCSLAVGAVAALIAVTGFDPLCRALQRLGVPRSFTTQLLLLHRYLFVLAEEARRMLRARSLRGGPAGRGPGLRVYGALVGHLLLRSLDRGQRIHRAMSCRGFSGELPLAALPVAPQQPSGRGALLFVAGWSALFVGLRFVDLPLLLGSLVTGGWR